MALFGQVKKWGYTDDQKIKTVYDMLTRKGDDAVDAFKQRIATGEGITVHGLFFSLDIIQAAVEKFENSDENTENHSNNGRSRKAWPKLSDHERSIFGDELDECLSDLWRVRMETLGHKDLASEHSALTLAQQSIKTRRSSQGSLKNVYVSPADQGKYFRVISPKKIPILKDCNIKLKAIAYMNCGEVFAASGISTSQKDGRVYACLADGRGWACATSRADSGKAVIEAIGKQEFHCFNFDEDAQLRSGGCMRDGTGFKAQGLQLGQHIVSPMKRVQEDVAHDATPAKKRNTFKPSLHFVNPPMFGNNVTPRKLDLD